MGSQRSKRSVFRAHKINFGTQSRLNGLKSLAKLFNLVVFQSMPTSPSLPILVPLCFVIISLVFFYLLKVLFSGFLQFKVHLTPNFFFGQDETLQHSHKEFDNIISIWYF